MNVWCWGCLVGLADVMLFVGELLFGAVGDVWLMLRLVLMLLMMWGWLVLKSVVRMFVLRGCC